MARIRHRMPGIYNATTLGLSDEEGSALGVDVTGNLLARGSVVRVSGTFTRPANTTAYTAGDVVSNNATTTTPLTLSGVTRANGQSVYLMGLRIETDQKSITPRFRIHFFSTSGATVAADNAAYKELYADASLRRGHVDLLAMTTATDTTNSTMSRSEDFTIRRPICLATADTALYVVLETLDAFTPTSGESFTVIALFDQN